MNFVNLVLLLFPTIAVAELTCSSDSCGVRVFENFFSNDDIESIYANQKSLPKTSSWEWEAQDLGATFLSKDQVQKFNHAVHNTNEGVHEPTYVMLKTMTRTSTPHCDETLNEEGEMEPLVEEDVAVVFLNTNRDALFEIEGMERPIPVKAGSLVTFPGGKQRHRTIVKSGFVSLAGGFSATSPHRLVMRGCNPCPDKWTFGWFIYKIKLLFGKAERCDDNCGDRQRALTEHWVRVGMNDRVEDVTDTNGGVTLEA